MQIKRKKISAKLTKEGGNFAKFTRERTYFNSDYSTSILMMGQIMNQVMPCNKEPSHNQLSYFGSRIISSFRCGNNSQRNPNLEESSNISERHSQNINSIAQMGEEKTYHSL